MKNTVIKLNVLIAIICSCNTVNSQVSILGNTSINQAHFVGWNNTVTFPLDIRHDAFQPIIFSTNATERMRIAQWGNVAVGGSINPRAKLEVVLNNDNAAEPPFFESTALMAYNR